MPRLLPLLLLLTLSPAPALAAGPAPVEDDAPPAATSVPGSVRPYLAGDPAGGAAGLVGSARKPARRHGLGLPSYAEVLGRGWKRKVAAADRAFKAKLARPLPEGRAAVDEFEARYGAKDTVKGPAGRQVRRLRVSAGIDGGCPRPLDDLYGAYGWHGEGEATYEIQTLERAGRYDVLTRTALHGKFTARPAMLEEAVPEEWHKADTGSLVIVRAQTAIDRRTGKRRSLGKPDRVEIALDPFYKADGLSEFVERAGDPDPEPAPKRKLRTADWQELTSWFLAVPYEAMRAQVVAAGKKAATPNACVKLGFPAAPTHLATGATAPLIGVPTLVEDPAVTPFGILDHASRSRAEWVNHAGQTAVPAANIRRIAAGDPWWVFKAPAAAWPATAPIGLDVTLFSAAGIATARVTFLPEDGELYFRVLDAKIEAHTTASRERPGCGTVGGARSYGATFSGEAFDPEDRISLGSYVTGSVSADVDARTYADTVFGCRYSPSGPCEATMPERTIPNAQLSVSFSAAEDPARLRVDWGVRQPEVGFQDAGDDECNAYVWGVLPEGDRTTTVPRDKLQGKEPVELVLAGQRHLDRFATGSEPASIDHTWEYRLTVQRVGADGQPLP